MGDKSDADVRGDPEIESGESDPKMGESFNLYSFGHCIEDILVKLAKQEPIDFSSYKPVSDDEVKLAIEQLIRENPGAKSGLLMGKAMRHFENKVDGKKVQQLLRDLGVQ